MPQDIFEQLAQLNVPPPPPQLDRAVHDRVNRSLVALHLADLLLRGMPWAMLHFGRAVIGLIGLTLRGKSGDDRRGGNEKKSS